MDWLRLKAVLQTVIYAPRSVRAKLRTTYWYNAPEKEEVGKEFPNTIWKSRLFCEHVHITRGDLNELVMDFLVAEGFGDAAENFQRETGAKQMDRGVFEVRLAVKNAVHTGDTAGAIAKLRDFNPEILDSDFNLLFCLQQQRVIELAQNKKFEDALDLCLSMLAPMAENNANFMTELEQTLVLLIFEDASSCPVGNLLAISRLPNVARYADGAILTSFGFERDSELHSLMKLLEWLQRELDAIGKYPSFDFDRSWIIYP